MFSKGFSSDFEKIKNRQPMGKLSKRDFLEEIVLG
jgi:hypothetical protein